VDPPVSHPHLSLHVDLHIIIGEHKGKIKDVHIITEARPIAFFRKSGGGTPCLMHSNIEFTAENYNKRERDK
jgi:hypothetical protein